MAVHAGTFCPMQHMQSCSDQSSKITPPGTFTVRPPTPPATDEKPSAKVTKLISALKQREAGHGFFTIPWTVIALSPSDFIELEHQIYLDQLLGGYVDDKVRYDYFSRKQQLVFRMPSMLHETFVRAVERGIIFQLDALAASSSSAADLARSIHPTGSPRLRFEEAAATEEGTSTILDQHEPDISFTHADAKWPGVIIEVSYSGKRKDLPWLADDYIMGSDGNIRVVIGLDVEYRGARSAALLVWRPKLVVGEDGQAELRTVKTEVDKLFRLEDGTPVSSTQLCLRLEDFAPEPVVERFTPEGETISFSAETLCQYLELAEVQMQTSATGISVSLPAGVRKRGRTPTPPEELALEDEATFRRQEELAANRADFDDLSYEGTPSPQDEEDS